MRATQVRRRSTPLAMLLCWAILHLCVETRRWLPRVARMATRVRSENSQMWFVSVENVQRESGGQKTLWGVCVKHSDTWMPAVAVHSGGHLSTCVHARSLNRAVVPYVPITRHNSTLRRQFSLASAPQLFSVLCCSHHADCGAPPDTPVPSRTSLICLCQGSRSTWSGCRRRQ